MSDYKYETEIGRLDIKTSHSPKLVFVWVHEDTQQAAIHIPNDDVPRVALELLKAAGYGDEFERSRSEWLTVELLEDLVTEAEARKADA